MRKAILLFNILFCSIVAYSQNVGIGTSSPAAILDVSATNSGILIPRVALTGTGSYGPLTSLPTISTLVYNTATVVSGATSVSPGFYYWNGSAWVRVIDNASIGGATTVGNTSSANTLSTTVNGVTGTGVSIINSNTLGLSGNTLTSTVNGIAPTQSLSGLSLTGDVTGTLAASTVGRIQGTGVAISSLVSNNLLQYNGTNWVNVTPASVLGAATTNALSLSTNTLTSTVNGIAATSSAVSGVSNTSSANILSTTVNGVTGSTVPIINTNTLGLSGTSITSTINNVASTPLDLSSIDNNIYNSDGTLTGNRAVTMGADNLTFSSSSGNLIFNPSSTGKVGIGTVPPFSKTTIAITSTNSISYLDAGNNAALTIAGTDALVRLQMGIGGNTVGPYGSWIQSSYDNSSSSYGTEPLLLNPQGGHVGAGTSAPTATLSVGVTGASLGGTSASPVLNTYAGNLGTTAGNALKLASFGFGSSNQSSLGIKALRTANGNGWDIATAIGLEMDVDATDAAGGAQIWLNSNGNVGIGTTSPAAALDITSTTSGFLPPRLAGNPVTPAQGMIYYNTATNCLMMYNGSNWQNVYCACVPTSVGNGVITYTGGNTIVTYTTVGSSTFTSTCNMNVVVLVVAGGGGGGGGNTDPGNGGGGGAGGYIYTPYAVTAGTSITVTVGGGGAGGTGSGGGTNGGNSIFGTITATGGGGGGSYSGANAQSGGSGGGAGQSGTTPGAGSGIVGQGYSGGSESGTPYCAAGGGGASAVGGAATGQTGCAGGVGGAGTANSISGSSVYYAGGGGGSTHNSGSVVALGGIGGGGNGHLKTTVATAGAANTGGGGGGGGESTNGAAGGSGIVIISYVP